MCIRQLINIILFSLSLCKTKHRNLSQPLRKTQDLVENDVLEKEKKKLKKTNE